MKRIQSENISFAFSRNAPVLRDVSLASEPGEVLAILGASGCGKSTLLRIFAGLLKPEGGRILFAGAEAAAKSGFVFQTPTLCPWRNVIHNVELPGQLASEATDVRRQAALDAIRLVGLAEEDGLKFPRQLSGGMQMRVSLARALVTQPEVMLLDEPFSALDEVLRQQLCDVYLNLCRLRGWTTVMVTHNVAEAVYMSQRVVILAGRPATVVGTFGVPFGARTPDLLSSLDYLQLTAKVSDHLRSAVEAG